MMGRQAVDQSQLFYLFNLEKRIPERHLLRRVNPTVTRILAELREKLDPFYSEIGRPSIDPELMIRMLIVGYCYGIRFERRLCEEVELHLAYRWFCRLDFLGQSPRPVPRQRLVLTFDRERNVYVCPADKLLTTTGNVGDDHAVRYRASKRDCAGCPLKPRCRPNTPSRKVTRDLHEDARDHARALMGTPEFDKSRDERKKVEMRFAHLKTHHGFERMRLRGLSGARDEFHLAAIVQNLKTLAKHIWRPRPHEPAACVA